MFGLAAIPVIGPFLALVPGIVWKYLGLFALAASIYGYADVKATYREHAKCEAAAKAAQDAANEQDIKAEKDGRAQDLEITNALVEQKKVDDETIQKLKADIAKNPLTAACTYPVTAPPARGVRKHGFPLSRANDKNNSGAAQLPAADNGPRSKARR